MKEEIVASSVLVGAGLISSATILSTYLSTSIGIMGFDFASMKTMSVELTTILYLSYVSIALGFMIFCLSFLKKRRSSIETK